MTINLARPFSGKPALDLILRNLHPSSRLETIATRAAKLVKVSLVVLIPFDAEAFVQKLRL